MNIKRLIMITFLFACYGAGMVGKQDRPESACHAP